MPVDTAHLKRLFEGEIKTGLVEARAALAKGDVAAVLRFAHSLAGVAPSLGHDALGRVASVIARLGALAGSGERPSGAALTDPFAEALDALELVFRQSVRD